VTVSLREIAEHTAGQRIELFGQQTHVVAARQQAIEQLSSFRITALQNVIVHEPKAARQKRTLALRRPITRILGFVAQNKLAIDHEFVLDRPERSLDTRIVRGKKTDKWKQQQAGIDSLGAIGLHEAV